jgi:hypothetical protein
MSRKIFIALAVTGLTLVASGPAAYAAGFGLEFEGGGNVFNFLGAVGEEKTLFIVNQTVTGKKLTSLTEASRNGGKEDIEVNANERTTCVNKNYAALETCAVKLKLLKLTVFPEPVAELEFVAQPAGCPNRAEATA